MPTLAPFVLGTYNPATYVEGNPATYPPLPAGAVYYQPGMSWQSIGTGTMAGQLVKPGDLIFAVARQRTYGERTYGDLIYGGTGATDWPPELTTWVIWNSSLPGWLQPPFPFSGCPFTRSDTPGGDWAPGWRIVVDALYLDLVGSRVYGSQTYGSAVFGDSTGGTVRWADITRPSYSVRAIKGHADGRDTVPVDTIEIQLADESGAWVDFPAPTYYYRPFVGDAIRVGLLDPTHAYHPVCVGQIELIADEHDGDHPRTVVVQAFGHVMDLVVDIIGWQRPAEKASTRFNALMAAGGWRYGSGALVFPGDADLMGDAEARDITVRDEIDRTAQSAGWTFDTDRWGGPRLRTWPVVGATPTVQVVDCLDVDAPAGAVLSPGISYVNDQQQLLNRVVISNATEPTPITRQVEDATSIGLWGKRDRALGFPKQGLAFTTATAADAIVRRALDRYAFVVRRVDRFIADTLSDADWLPILADLDTGRAVRVTRLGMTDTYVLDAVVSGVDHTITPGRFVTAATTTTVTRTY